MTAAPKPSPRVRQRNKEFIDRLLGVVAIVTILAAYIFGLTRAETDVIASFQQLVPSAQRFEPVSETVYAAYTGVQLVAYITLGEATGYGGDLEMAVAVDPQGKLVNLAILDDQETSDYNKRVAGAGWPGVLAGKSCQDPFQLGQDVDGITGATYTASAIAEAVRRGCRQMAALGVGDPSAAETRARIQFGVPEVTLILLFAVGFFAHRQKFKYTRQARWVSMIAGMLILGFWFNRPLSIININQLLLGTWPSWQNNLYWYLLLGGIFLVTTADNKNPYCEWFCPFGATQECLGAVGGAKVRSPGKFKPYLVWLHRGLAWLAIVLALIFRNPTISSYEVFSGLFDRIASTPIFIVLGIVLVASLFIKRPWCTYLCPLQPVVEFIQMIRKWVIELWKKTVRTTA
ncbi:MAG TPA: 4Fe-4S binding protein [Anaerolineales bacterium]|nr:4Fe-4S binding protein [Anaerolineales bacterium]